MDSTTRIFNSFKTIGPLLHLEYSIRRAVQYSPNVGAMVQMGRPDEIAKAAGFLASNDNNVVIGIELFG
jgi:hypothetical protein